MLLLQSPDLSLLPDGRSQIDQEVPQTGKRFKKLKMSSQRSLQTLLDLSPVIADYAKYQMPKESVILQVA